MSTQPTPPNRTTRSRRDAVPDARRRITSDSVSLSPPGKVTAPPLCEPAAGTTSQRDRLDTRSAQQRELDPTSSDRALERLACVHVPALPLQLLVKRHPEWADRPVAVVDQDKPQGTILWVSEEARRTRVLPGLRYAAGLSLCSRLCAAEISDEEIEQGSIVSSRCFGGSVLRWSLATRSPGSSG